MNVIKTTVFTRMCSLRKLQHCAESEKKKSLPISDQQAFALLYDHYSGGDRSRTGVQTYSSKAFYMFIPELIVGK